LKEMNFKTTIKGAARIGQIAMGDLWVHVLSFILLVVSLGVGVHKLVNGPTVITTLAISVVWIVYALIPPFLLIWYTFIGRGGTLKFWCRCAACPRCCFDLVVIFLAASSWTCILVCRQNRPLAGSFIFNSGKCSLVFCDANL